MSKTSCVTTCGVQPPVKVSQSMSANRIAQAGNPIPKESREDHLISHFPISMPTTWSRATSHIRINFFFFPETNYLQLLWPKYLNVIYGSTHRSFGNACRQMIPPRWPRDLSLIMPPPPPLQSSISLTSVCKPSQGSRLEGKTNMMGTGCISSYKPPHWAFSLDLSGTARVFLSQNCISGKWALIDKSRKQSMSAGCNIRHDMTLDWKHMKLHSKTHTYTHTPNTDAPIPKK